MFRNDCFLLLLLRLLLLLLYCQNEASVQITAATAAAPVAAGVGTVRIPERHVCRILGHACKSWPKSIYFAARRRGWKIPEDYSDP